MKNRWLSNPFLAALIAALAPLLFTLVAWRTAMDSHATQIQSQFEAYALENEKALKHRIESYEQALVSGAGFFQGEYNVTREQWRRYVEAIDIKARLPGISGIGFIADVPKSEISAHVAAQRKDGYPQFDIHPDYYRDQYFIITYIEPVETNTMAVGLNIAFEENRRIAANLAIDTGQSAITKRILLVQDKEKRPGFLLLHPMYNKNVSGMSVSDRRNAFAGWIYAPFIGANFLSNLTNGQGALYNLQVYDGAKINSDYLIFDGGHDQNKGAQYRSIKTIQFMQQAWTLVWTSTPQFEGLAKAQAPKGILLGGGGFTIIFAAFVFLLKRQTQIVESEVMTKTREISEARQRLSMVLDTAAEGIITIEGKGRIRVANAAAERLFNVKQKQIVGKSISRFLDTENGPVDISSLKEIALKSGRAEMTGVQRNGAKVPVEIAVSNFTDPSGSGAVICVHDVSERKRQQEALRASEETLRTAMQHAPIGKGLLSSDGQWTFVNPALCQLLGHEQDALLNSRFENYFYDLEGAAALRQRFHIFEQASKTYQSEVQFSRKSGKSIWVLLNVTRVEAGEGSLKYYIVQMQDITERKEIDHLKSEFISIVSHELRTPLTSIRGSLSLVLGSMSANVPEGVLKLLSIAQKNSERLVILINDILDLDRISSGQMRFKLCHQNIQPLIQQAISDNKPYANEFGVNVQYESIENETPVLVDENRTLQVLTNLLSNAVKFSHRGGVVFVTLENSNGRYRVSVCDNGEGVPVEATAKLFEKFYQVDSSSVRQKGGSGLGLHICQKIIHKMNGDIGYKPNPEGGSIFWFEIQEVQEAPMTIISDMVAGAGGAGASGVEETTLPKVLHIEDDADLSHVIASSLGGKASLDCACTLQVARQLTQLYDYALIIIDPGMPDGDGLEFINELEKTAGVKPGFIILSAEEIPTVYHARARVSLVKSTISEEYIATCVLNILQERKAA